VKSQLFEKNQDFFKYICVVNRFFKLLNHIKL
jgi:hypothetical protein